MFIKYAYQEGNKYSACFVYLLQPITYEYHDSDYLWPSDMKLETFWKNSGDEMVMELVGGFMADLESVLDSVSADIQDHVTAVTRAISQAASHFQTFREKQKLDEDFVR